MPQRTHFLGKSSLPLISRVKCLITLNLSDNHERHGSYWALLSSELSGQIPAPLVFLRILETGLLSLATVEHHSVLGTLGVSPGRQTASTHPLPWSPLLPEPNGISQLMDSTVCPDRKHPLQFASASSKAKFAKQFHFGIEGLVVMKMVTVSILKNICYFMQRVVLLPRSKLGLCAS